MTSELTAKVQEIHGLAKALETVEKQLREHDEVMNKKDEEIHGLAQQLYEKEQELNDLTNCEEHVIMIASETELGLRD